MKYLILCLCWCLVPDLFAQVSNTGMASNYDSTEAGKISVGGYADIYYGFDFNRPGNAERLYAVSSSRHNELNVNLTYVDISYHNDQVRARIIPGFGTYMNNNYSNETGTLRFLVEANAGVRIFRKRNIWMDAGILPSPYTNESAVSKDHLMYTRAFASEYVPYYLCGARLSVPVHKKVKVMGYFLNGWQVIRDNNSNPALGTQVEYRPNDRLLLDWNTYIGNERSAKDSLFGTRYFSDVYAIYNPEGKISMTTCIYAGVQDKKDTLGNRSSGRWWQANLAVRYKFNKRTSLSGRIEYFEDVSSIQIRPVNSGVGFSTFSGGLCLNVRISGNALFRLEHRLYYSEKKVYLDRKRMPVNMDNLAIGSLAVWF